MVGKVASQKHTGGKIAKEARVDRDMIREVIKEFEDSGRMKVLEDNIIRMNEILMGNEVKIGICEKVRNIQKTLIPLWTLVSVIGIALITGVIKLLIGK